MSTQKVCEPVDTTPIFLQQLIVDRRLPGALRRILMYGDPQKDPQLERSVTGSLPEPFLNLNPCAEACAIAPAVVVLGGTCALCSS